MKTEEIYTNIVSIAKPYKSDSYIEFSDSEGWSDGVMAELNPNIEVKSKAMVLNSKGKMLRFVVEGNKPKVKHLIPTSEPKWVTDIEWDIKTNNLILTSDKLKVAVNPMFVKFFVKRYGNSIYFGLGIDNVAIRVYDKRGDTELRGIIMPIKL